MQIIQPEVLAAWHLDASIRRLSSSGGVFTALAERILKKGGVVAGAAFNEEMVVQHRIIETTEDLRLLRGSKYVQSDLTPQLYAQMQGFLKQGRSVLFSGTPCQVAGIKSYLNVENPIFYCCDIACLGVPSPALLNRYINENLKQGEVLKTISFRDKTTGWKRSSLRWQLRSGASRTFGPAPSDPYMTAFLKGIALRQSCYRCSFKGLKREGDITMADFWGASKKYPQYDLDDKGTSLILVNSEKGHQMLNDCRDSLFLGTADIDTAIAGNPMLVRPALRPPERINFYNDLNTLGFKKIARRYRLGKQPLHYRAVNAIKRRLKGAIRRLRHAGNRQA